MEGYVNEVSYIECLQRKLVPWLEQKKAETSRNFIFQEDGSKFHTSAYAKHHKAMYGIQGFDFWPAQSPDLNPIEHVWAYLERKLDARRTEINNIKKLREVLQEEWDKIPKEYILDLIGSMTDRCKAVIKAKGGNTKY